MCCGLQVLSQSDENFSDDQKAIVYLKEGTELEVKIIDWDDEKGMKAMTLWGQELFFAQDRILKVKSFSNKLNWKPYQFKDKGVYYSLMGGFISANHGPRLNGTNGYTMSFSAGYRFHRLFSVGLGTGVDQYAHNSGERVHPIFVDLRSYLLPSNRTIVLNVQAGYGLTFNNDPRSIVDSKGGFMFYPNIGLSFGESQTKFSFDVGYKIQRSQWTYASRWDERNQTEYRLNYKRFVIRFGINL